MRGLASLLVGLTIGLIGIDFVTGQQRLTMGVPQLADGIDVVVVAVGIFMIGEALWVAAARRKVIPVGRPWMEPRGLEAVVEAMAAPGTASWSFPFGAIPAGGGDADLPLLHDGEEALQAPRGVRQGRHRGRCRAGGGQQRFCRGHARAHARAGAADERDGRHHAGRALGLWHGAGAAAPRAAGPGVGALVASLFIGNTMLLVLNLPLAPAWAKLLQIPRPYLYLRHPLP